MAERGSRVLERPVFDLGIDDLRRRMDAELFEYELIREKLDRTRLEVETFADLTNKITVPHVSHSNPDVKDSRSSLYGGLAVTNVKDLGIY